MFIRSVLSYLHHNADTVSSDRREVFSVYNERHRVQSVKTDEGGRDAVNGCPGGSNPRSGAYGKRQNPLHSLSIILAIPDSKHLSY